ncbi:MAG TPA: hypothetical protein PLR12_07995, partial [Clostridia bacterium]|nr:hypothetical protein [Clostridia bacterium]
MVHTFTVNGYSIALDVFSGAVHIADKVSLEAIRLYETRGREDVTAALLSAFPDEPGLTCASIAELLDTLDALKAAGKLYSSDDYLQGARPMKDGGL